MNYSELLNSDEWRLKRSGILKRDEHRCQKCNNSNIFLNSRRGIVGNMIKNFIGQITIREFNMSDYLVINISKKEFSLLKSETLILFEENEGWCNVIGVRSMSDAEKDTYINKRNLRSQDALTTLIAFETILVDQNK